MAFVWKTDVQLPWWGMLFAFGLTFVVTLPVGVIQATTNQVLTPINIYVISSLSLSFPLDINILFRCKEGSKFKILT